MGTVLVDRYRLICLECSYEREFMVGADAGSLDAEKRAVELHAAEQQRRQTNCPGEFLSVMIEEKNDKGGSRRAVEDLASDPE